jgi:hypothetical protein
MREGLAMGMTGISKGSVPVSASVITLEFTCEFWATAAAVCIPICDPGIPRPDTPD